MKTGYETLRDRFGRHLLFGVVATLLVDVASLGGLYAYEGPKLPTIVFNAFIFFHIAVFVVAFVTSLWVSQIAQQGADSWDHFPLGRRVYVQSVSPLTRWGTAFVGVSEGSSGDDEVFFFHLSGADLTAVRVSLGGNLKEKMWISKEKGCAVGTFTLDFSY